MINSAFILIVSFSFVAACNDADLTNPSSGQKSLTKDSEDAKESNSAITGDEAVVPPSRISGSYLLCQPRPELNTDTKWTVDCGIYRKADQSIPPAVGTWTAYIADRTNGEAVTLQDSQLARQDNQFARFVIESKNRDTMPSTLSRLHVAFSGTVDGLVENLTTDDPLKKAGTVSSPLPTTTEKTPDSSLTTCDAGYVLVPGDSSYQTTNFCIMKYEAKDEGFGKPASSAFQIPWTILSQTGAIAACRALGTGYELVSNADWMTATTNIAGLASNWTSGTLGTGQLFVGHSDSDPLRACAASSNDALFYVETTCLPIGNGDTVEQKRTHVLSNGQVIWDLGGNVDEVLNFSAAVRSNAGATAEIYEFTDVIENPNGVLLRYLVPTKNIKSFWNDTWNSTQSIGKYMPGIADSQGVLVRGGEASYGVRAGIFTANFAFTPDEIDGMRGFRCAYHR